MKAEQIIEYLLTHNAALAAVVGDRIWSPVRPEEALLIYPVVTHSVISETETPPIDVMPGYCVVQGRVQITAVSDTYPVVKQVLELVRLAVNYQSGLIVGVRVVSVLRDIVGPDLYDPTVRAYSQPCDYVVTYYE